MKKLLFEQFKAEVKAASKEELNLMIKVVEFAEKNVGTNNLKLFVYDVKNNFDALIMDDVEYDTFVSTREDLISKYTDVESFKNGLVEFKEALQNVNKTKSNKSEKVESKASFTETTVEEKQEEETVNEEVKLIMEDGPISDNMMQLLGEVKNCIGTELFTEANFKEKVSKLHETGLLTKLLMSNEKLKSEMVNDFGVEDITDEDISQLFSSLLGLKLLLKELDVESMNYIVEVIKDIEESQKEETVVDSNTTFTNTVVENNPVQQPVTTNTITNNKSLMQEVIMKCNQDAEAISRDLVQAEQILRESQTVNDSVEVSNVFINNMGMNMQGTVNNNPSVFNQPIVTDMEDNTNIYAPIVEEIVKNVVKEESKPEVKQQPKKDKNICKYEGCDNKTHTKGYCYKHYKQLKEEGVIGGNKNAK